MVPEKEKNKCTTKNSLVKAEKISSLKQQLCATRDAATFQLSMLVFSHCKNTEPGFLINILLCYHDKLYVQYIFPFKSESK